MDLVSTLLGRPEAAAALTTPVVLVPGPGMLLGGRRAATVRGGGRAGQPTGAAAQSAASATLTRVAQAIAALGVPAERIQSASVVLFPETRTDPETNQVRTVGFRAEQTLTVTTPNLAQVGPIIDAAVSQGANIVENISFTVREPTQAQLAAIGLASRDAQLQAVVLARQFGLALTGVRRVSTSLAAPPIPLRLGVQFAVAAPTPIFPGQQTIPPRGAAENPAPPVSRSNKTRPAAPGARGPIPSNSSCRGRRRRGVSGRRPAG